jgi:SNF2 family DNA or RNA helicase
VSAPFIPKRYQTMGASYLVDHQRCMLVADPGLGKTGTTLLALELLKMMGSEFFPALVLAPKRVADVVWDGERDKWDSFKNLSIIKVLGEREQRLASLRKSVADLYVCNYENVEWLTSQWPSARWPFKIVIADESSRLKSFRLNKGGKRAAALSNIARFTGRWWNLTGTPSPNGLQDLWGQMWFVDFGERLKRSYTAFSEAFLMENPYSHKISLQAGAAASIHDLVKDRLLAFRAEDWLDLTEPQIIPMEFELNPLAKDRYRQMERDYFLSIDDKDIVAGTAMVKSAKLLQLCAGSIYDHESDHHHVHDDRLEVLDEVLEQTGDEPVLISYWWKPDVPRIMAHLEKHRVKARVYSGQKDEDDWNKGKIKAMLLQEQSGVGLNLHLPCRDVFMYTYTWSGELWQQFIGRVGPVRQAQAGKKCVVRVWYAKARGTIESEVIDSNFGKISVEQALKRARAQRYI